MLDPDFVYENYDIVQKGADLKRIKIDLPEFLFNYGYWKTMLKNEEELAHEQNVISDQIAILVKEKKHSEIKTLSEKSKKAKVDRIYFAKEVKDAEAKWKSVLLTFPAPPDDDVPVGFGPQDNVVIKTVGTETIGIFGEARLNLTMREK